MKLRKLIKVATVTPMVKTVHFPPNQKRDGLPFPMNSLQFIGLAQAKDPADLALQGGHLFIANNEDRDLQQEDIEDKDKQKGKHSCVKCTYVKNYANMVIIKHYYNMQSA